MQSSGIRGHYVAATSGVPLPSIKGATSAPSVGWATCQECGLRTRPGGFHVCIDLSGDEPVIEVPKPKPVKKPEARPRTNEAAPTTLGVDADGRPALFCACGRKLDPKAKRRCRACFTKKPDCGTIEGYRWHRRRGAQDPVNHPWPLPADDPCGCRAAMAEHTRWRRAREAA